MNPVYAEYRVNNAWVDGRIKESDSDYCNLKLPYGGTNTVTIESCCCVNNDNTLPVQQ
ncbi:hypothetical protein BOCO_0064 [Bombiscardovia coagulans]|uniref:Uncharacterized protein n=1 Tax=Bombiscardovia coagulans TaxID=686666 RepID=A0A261EVJ1_9BIFI|nr:hypothetical protein BOCO_0064 [Bombiscardovia coagulans]